VERFPCIALAYRALREGGTLAAAMNAANEEAVSAFLDERMRLTDIPRVIETVMDAHANAAIRNLDDVLASDKSARVAAATAIAGLAQDSAVEAVRN
jgi:1-deoxy-D-xylulose-5-phosphate reductoisomerase